MGKKISFFSLLLLFGLAFAFGQSQESKQMELAGGQKYTVQKNKTWKINVSDLSKFYFCQDETCDQKFDYQDKVEQLQNKFSEVEVKAKGTIWISGPTTILVKDGQTLKVKQYRLSPTDE